MKIPRHFGTAHLAKAGMMIGRHFAPLVMNLPLLFGKGQPEQARLSSMIQSPVKPYATAIHELCQLAKPSSNLLTFPLGEDLGCGHRKDLWPSQSTH